MLTFTGYYPGPDTDRRSYHSYSNCWTMVGHSPNDSYFPSFHRCINCSLENIDLSQKVILMVCGGSEVTVLSLWFKSLLLSSWDFTILLPSVLGLASIPNYLLILFSLGHLSLQVLILFTDPDCWLQPSINSICLCFLRTYYIKWHKSTFSPNFLLEALSKARWHLIVCLGGGGQACTLSPEQWSFFSIAPVQRRPHYTCSKFVADTVTEATIVYPGVPQPFNLFLTVVHLLFLFYLFICFWGHGSCGSLSTCVEDWWQTSLQTLPLSPTLLCMLEIYLHHPEKQCEEWDVQTNSPREKSNPG